MTRPQRLAVLAALYFSQGLPYGFFTLALPIVLRQHGLDLRTVAASGLLLLPWALKFLWGPLVDGFGTRRSWIVPLQLLSVAVLLGLATMDPTTELRALGLGMLAMAVLASTQDVATDGLAVELLPDEDRGLGNGLQVGAYRLGMILGGSALLVVYSRLGPAAAFGAMAGMLLLATGPLILLRELPRRRPQGLHLGQWLLAIPHIGGRWWLLLALYKAGDAMASPMVKTLLVDAGFETESLAWLMGLLGSTAGLVGAMLGGLCVDRVGRGPALTGFGVLQALGLLTNVVPAWFGATTASAVAVVLIEHVVSGMATASLFAAMMDRCRPGHEASDYTLQACVVVLASGLMGSLAGSVAETQGYVVHFALSSALSMVAVLAALWALAPSGARHGP